MEVIPNKAPQKAYILQPVKERKENIPWSVFFVWKTKDYMR